MATVYSLSQFLLQDNDPEMISVTTTGEKVNPVFRFQDIIQPELNLNLLKGLQQHLGLKRPTRLQSIFLGLACEPLFHPLIVQCPPTSEKIRCYAFTLLLHIKTSVKQPQALCIVPSKEDGEEVLKAVQEMGIFMDISGVVTDNKVKGDEITSQVVIGTPAVVVNLFFLKG
ncbi:ATP-dependent RNA helicase dbp5-like [Helianthus annuus]|uniref:ATP-dependent RNA helicase dbp5-like n=1 Tax=Helianthus annuus TaxID=4232 RepID=UPI000B8FDEF8|nr:ATP-dependent RNA helicase dbp5-like [Helianthus annuus]